MRILERSKMKKKGIVKRSLLCTFLLASTLGWMPAVNAAQLFQVKDAGEFFAAIGSAQPGDTVKLTSDIFSRDYGQSGVRKVNLNGITLDGAGHQLHLVSMPIYLQGNSTIKDINLALEATGNITLDQYENSIQDGTVPVYANGHDLTFDNVDTTVPQKSNYQPTVYLGGDSGSHINAENTFKTINSQDNKTKFKNIVAGSQNAAKTGKSRIELDAETRIVGYKQGAPATEVGNNAISLRNEGEAFKNQALDVEVINESRYIQGYDQGSLTNAKIELKDNAMFSPLRTNQPIKELTVSGTSTLLVEKDTTINTLVLNTTGNAPAISLGDSGSHTLTIKDLKANKQETINASAGNIKIEAMQGEVKLEGNKQNSVTFPADFQKGADGVVKPNKPVEDAQPNAPEEPPTNSVDTPQTEPPAPTEPENNTNDTVTNVPPENPNEDATNPVENETGENGTIDTPPKDEAAIPPAEVPNIPPAPSDTEIVDTPPAITPENPSVPEEDVTTSPTLPVAPPAEDAPHIPVAGLPQEEAKEVSKKWEELVAAMGYSKEDIYKIYDELEGAPIALTERMEAIATSLALSAPKAETLQKVQVARKDITTIGSLAAAITSLEPAHYNAKEKTTFMAGVGTYDGMQSYVIGVHQYHNQAFSYHGNLAFNTKDKASFIGNVGLTWNLKKISPTINAYGKTPSRKVALLQEAAENMEERLQVIDKKLNQLLHK